MKMLAGIDLGTTGCRCILFDLRLGIVGEEYIEHPLITMPDGGVEQDANLWWELLCRVLRSAACKARVLLSDVLAVGISSQGITVVPVDRKMRPLCNAISWLDNRPDSFGAEIDQAMGQRYVDITARLTPASYGLGRVMWLKRNRPEIMENAYKVLMPMEYIIAKLCGEPVTDHSMAAGMGCYDIAQRCWSEEILRAAGLSAGWFAPIAPSGSIAGAVNSEAAALCGLAAGTPVAVGAQDQKCGGVSAGLADGIATVSMGTCLAMLAKVDKVVCDPDFHLPCFSDLFADGYLLEAVLAVGAGCLKWYHDIYYPHISYREVVGLAAAHKPTAASPFFFPYLQGRSTPRRMVCTGSFTNLTLDTSGGALAHSVLEGVSFGLRENVEAVATTSGRAIELLRVFGGGAKDRYWIQQISDICNLPAESLYTHEMPCAGAAILAGIGVGIYANQQDAQQYSVKIKDVCEPDAEMHKIYSDRYAAYLDKEKHIYG